MDAVKDGHIGSMVNCPICNKEFWQRDDFRPVTCSRSCARKLEWQKKQTPVRVKAPSGYWFHVVPDEHPYGYKLHERGRGKYILEHRFVVEQRLGRYLEPRERVHHKDGDRENNDDLNLELWTLDHGSNIKDPPGVRTSDICCNNCCGCCTDEKFSIQPPY